MKRTMLGLIAALVVAAGAPVEARGQDDAKKAIEAIIPKPTKQHELLKRDVGTWDATVKFWMGDPDAPPGESKGVEKNTLLGGLWLVSEFEGDFAGIPFHGRGQQGYDTKKGKYVGTWIDSMTDKIAHIEGTYDEKTDSLTTFMDSEDPRTGKPVKERHVQKYVGDDTRVYTFYMPGEGGKEVKTMEITYKRRKS